MSKLLEEMQALAGVAKRNMWETKITLPNKETKSSMGNKSGTTRSPGTGAGEEYEEPEPDGEFVTDDPEDEKAVKKAAKKYKADREKEDEKEDEMDEPDEAEEPDSSEPDEDEADEGEDDEAKKKAKKGMKEESVKDAMMVAKMGELLKTYGVKIEFGKNITISGKPTYLLAKPLKFRGFRFQKNPPMWVLKGLQPKNDTMLGLYRSLLKVLQKTGMKESLMGGPVPNSPVHKVTHLEKCCDSCEMGGECDCEKKRKRKRGDIKVTMESLLERQKTDPTLAGPGAEKPTRKGSFKVSSAELKFWADEIDKAGKEMGPQALLFKKVRDHIHNIPRNDLPKIWGADNMADAQDIVMGKPKRAFQMWLRNVKKVSPKMHGYLQKVPSNVSLVYFGFLVRVVGMMSAKSIFKRYFETDSDHYGSIKSKKGRDAFAKKAKDKQVKDAMARAKK